MTDTDTQPVVDATKTTAEPVVADDSARNDGNDLDSLLAQFEKDTKPPVSPAPTTTATPPPVDNGRIVALENRLFQEDLNKAVTNIMGDLKVPRRMATGWLDQIAREKPEVAQAFVNQASNPKQWEQIERVLAKEFAKEVKSVQVDEEATEDRDAVAAAVRGASTRAPADAPVNFGNQSNSEFRNTVKEKYGFDPGV